MSSYWYRSHCNYAFVLVCYICIHIVLSMRAMEMSSYMLTHHHAAKPTYYIQLSIGYVYWLLSADCSRDCSFVWSVTWIGWLCLCKWSCYTWPTTCLSTYRVATCRRESWSPRMFLEHFLTLWVVHVCTYSLMLLFSTWHMTYLYMYTYSQYTYAHSVRVIFCSR